MPRHKLDKLLQAPEDEIRAVLRALCLDTQVRARALDRLRSIQFLDRWNLEFLGPAAAAAKRKAEGEIQVCVQCDAAFYNMDNNKTSCYYHWGECEPVYGDDYRTGYGEPFHGPIDTKEKREGWPKLFTWTCCDKTYDELGCTHDMHEADPRKSRRECGYEPSDLEEDEDDEDDNENDDEDEDEDEDMDEEDEEEDGEEDDDEEPVFLYERKKRSL